jgi:hypothetical protein
MKNFVVSILIVGIALTCVSFSVFDKLHVSGNMLRFLESNSNHYSKWKKDIPKDVWDGIKKFESGNFNPGDTGDEGKIGMGCLRKGGAQFEGQLNFVVTNDSLCILAYGHGSIGLSNTVYFVHYTPPFALAKYRSLGDWTDTSTASVIKALQNNPIADTIWTKSD